MSALAQALADAGGVTAPPQRTAQLRSLLTQDLQRARQELKEKRSGYDEPLPVGFAAADDGLAAVVPADPALRADPDTVNERTWRLAAAVVGALHEAGGAGALTAGSHDGHLVLHLATADGDPELAALAFEDHAQGIDRLRAVAYALPAEVLHVEDRQEPVGPAHPLRVAHEVARLGGRPADPDLAEAVEEQVLSTLGAARAARPHDDPDPSRRVARRILQRLDGMGKWGGYHTEFAHLSRGFAPADRELAAKAGEALLKAGLLAEKPSVGQRHVFLNPRRAADVHRLIDDGEVPSDLTLP